MHVLRMCFIMKIEKGDVFMALFETIPYEVIKKDGSIEIRSYHDVLLASTTSKMNTRYDSGFMNFYIFI